MLVLVTGGSGYIGSHTCLELLEAGNQVVVVDNLDNSSEESLNRVRQLTDKPLDFYQVDLLDRQGLDRVFAQHAIDAVIHFAGLKAVGESVDQPLHYYHNNLSGTFNLCAAMAQHQVHDLVFSSSATVYGDPPQVPIDESCRLDPTNPYGHTKAMVEQILKDLHNSAPTTWNITLLRYFNPVGAHSSGRIGEDPSGVPNNLLPFVAQVAVEKLPQLSVFGDDWDTPDGTGVRDYIHVVDLALGHLKALEHLGGLRLYNLGTGRGYSVFEMIAAFEKASSRPVPYQVVDRRPGDIATCYAEASKAKAELGWSAQRGIEEMCADAWNWQSQNPNGYA